MPVLPAESSDTAHRESLSNQLLAVFQRDKLLPHAKPNSASVFLKANPVANSSEGNRGPDVHRRKPTGSGLLHQRADRSSPETGGGGSLADEHGFAVVYPNAYEGYWDVCNIVGAVSANGLNIDDVGFLTGMADKLVSEIGIDPGRVFAAGSSRGGFMAYRLALEAPSRFRAVAAVSSVVRTRGRSIGTFCPITTQ